MTFLLVIAGLLAAGVPVHADLLLELTTASREAR
jgi:hypothetical protein